MIASEPMSKPARGSNRYSHLENGIHVTASEFLRRYEASPEIKKAELINGIVFLGTAVRVETHGEPNALMQTWLGVYRISTPGVTAASRPTTLLSCDDVPEPDGVLITVPECGGQTRINSRGYLVGAPELVVEVAASSASIDAHEKLNSYRRSGVREYVLWRTLDEAVDWWKLVEDDYVPLGAGPDGVLRSQVFPGLWLAVGPLLAGDGAKVITVLQSGLQSPEHAAFVTKLHDQSQRAR